MWALGCSLLVLLSPVSVEIHSMAWTEPLFIFLSLAGAYFIACALRGEWFGIIYGALFLGLGFLTRYAGASLIGAASLAILLFSNLSFRQRFIRTFWFGVIAALPGLAWLGRNYLVAGTAANREFAIHFAPVISKVKEALTTVSSWLLVSEDAGGWLKLIPVVFLVGVVFLGLVYGYQFTGRTGINSSVTKSSSHKLKLDLILVTYIVVYLIFLIFSLAFFDANTPLDNRILSPVFFWVVILSLISLSNLLLQTGWKRVTGTIVLIVGVAMMATYSWESSSYIRQGYSEGLGFNNQIWTQSAVIRAVGELKTGLTIYSNSPEAIYVQTGRPARRVPAKYQTANQRQNPDYSAEMGVVDEQVHSDLAVVVWFTAIKRESLPSEDELINELSLKPLIQAADGVIYSAGDK